MWFDGVAMQPESSHNLPTNGTCDPAFARVTGKIGAALRAGHGPAGTAVLALGRGQSCFIAADEGAITAVGPGSLFIAASGLDPSPRA